MKYCQGDQVSFNRSLGGRSVLDPLLEAKEIPPGKLVNPFHTVSLERFLLFCICMP